MLVTITASLPRLFAGRQGQLSAVTGGLRNLRGSSAQSAQGEKACCCASTSSSICLLCLPAVKARVSHEQSGKPASGGADFGVRCHSPRVPHVQESDRQNEASPVLRFPPRQSSRLTPGTAHHLPLVSAENVPLLGRAGDGGDGRVGQECMWASRLVHFPCPWRAGSTAMFTVARRDPANQTRGGDTVCVSQS
jgi:hypothetical protein